VIAVPRPDGGSSCPLKAADVGQVDADEVIVPSHVRSSPLGGQRDDPVTGSLNACSAGGCPRDLRCYSYGTLQIALSARTPLANWSGLLLSHPLPKSTTTGMRSGFSLC
jgi:hypothetical protein